MYQIGKVYIWQNMVAINESLNGTECTVIGPPVEATDWLTNLKVLVQETDTLTYSRVGACHMNVHAHLGKNQLRPKHSPAGEQSVLDLFTGLHDLVPA